MSEERAAYLGGTPDSHEFEIRDEATPRDYYSQIPNIVDLMGLSPHAYRLYGHLRKVAGESGKCWQSTRTLALACNMSGGMISKSKQELEQVYPPLIRIESKSFDRGAYHEIAITDIWLINHAFFVGESVTIKRTDGIAFHNMNEWRSQYEQDRSQYETKNNPVKKNPTPADFELEVQTPAEHNPDEIKLTKAQIRAARPAKKGDMVDAYLRFGNDAIYAARLEELTARIKRGLGGRDVASEAGRQFVKFVDEREQKRGQMWERFTQWMRESAGVDKEGRSRFDPQYWSWVRMTENWDCAFEGKSQEVQAPAVIVDGMVESH